MPLQRQLSAGNGWMTGAVVERAEYGRNGGYFERGSVPSSSPAIVLPEIRSGNDGSTEEWRRKASKESSEPRISSIHIQRAGDTVDPRGTKEGKWDGARSGGRDSDIGAQIPVFERVWVSPGRTIRARIHRSSRRVLERKSDYWSWTTAGADCSPTSSLPFAEGSLTPFTRPHSHRT